MRATRNHRGIFRRIGLRWAIRLRRPVRVDHRELDVIPGSMSPGSSSLWIVTVATSRRKSMFE